MQKGNRMKSTGSWRLQMIAVQLVIDLQGDMAGINLDENGQLDWADKGMDRIQKVRGYRNRWWVIPDVLHTVFHPNTDDPNCNCLSLCPAGEDLLPAEEEWAIQVPFPGASWEWSECRLHLSWVWKLWWGRWQLGLPWGMKAIVVFNVFQMPRCSHPLVTETCI